jgi:peroxiredoxin (alkyl hydroperoxide reductase subunit C)
MSRGVGASGAPAGNTVIAAGTPVPELTLRRENGSAFTREDLRGTTTVLVFYPFAFSPVCTDQLSLYNEVLDEFAARGARLYGVSCDAWYSQKAFREQLGVDIEQLSDFEPKGATCRAFGVYHRGGFAQRALVIVGPDGVVRWSYQAASPGELPGANLIFDGLEVVPAA